MTDAFTDFVRGARRGRLKVFLGMAAGVGKTVAMLREAKRLRDEGVDVVCAFVESHGRAETERELEGLEVLPRKTVLYRGVPLEELDLEGTLARRPEVAVVDELAHTNVPGGAHAKRYEDVLALLDAGVSVMSALNVQHLEGLHEMVLRATGVDVRERVPDRVLARAHDVVAVDLAPEDLLERLRQGRVYPAARAELALRGFFAQEKLAALRQLALREVANAVEDRALAAPSAQRAAGASKAREATADAERVMVCLASQPSDARRAMQKGARLAGGPNSRWFAVYVRTPGESVQRIATGALRTLTDNLAEARTLGAEVVQLEGADVADTLAEFARSHAISHAVFGRTREPTWRARVRTPTLERFMRLAPEVDVLVIGEPRAGDPEGGRDGAREPAT